MRRHVEGKKEGKTRKCEGLFPKKKEGEERMWKLISWEKVQVLSSMERNKTD
jgi:hypothetical protein